MMTDEEFEAVVQEALNDLPPDIVEKIENIDIMIEDYPSKEIQQEMNISKQGLLGLYSGTPFNKRSPISYGNVLPDRIHLFKKNLESFCHSHQELKEQIQRTILHEIGHYFGISDKRLRELGF
jgi:predicted Zn-dependent protease with MMP-like domain